MNITDEKLKGAIQIALGTHGIYTEKIESDLIHHIKALTINGVVKSLKDRKAQTFEQWKESNYMHYDKNLFIRRQEGLKNIDDLKEIYKNEHNL